MANRQKSFPGEVMLLDKPLLTWAFFNITPTELFERFLLDPDVSGSLVQLNSS